MGYGDRSLAARRRRVAGNYAHKVRSAAVFYRRAAVRSRDPSSSRVDVAVRHAGTATSIRRSSRPLGVAEHVPATCTHERDERVMGALRPVRGKPTGSCGRHLAHNTMLQNGPTWTRSEGQPRELSRTGSKRTRPSCSKHDSGSACRVPRRGPRSGAGYRARAETTEALHDGPS